MKQNLCFTFLIAISIFIKGCGNKEKEYGDGSINKTYNHSKEGFVPDENTAIKIPEAIWPPIYGSGVLNEKPFKASLIGDTVWIIDGTFNGGSNGGVAHLEIRKSDCSILKVYHTK